MSFRNWLMSYFLMLSNCLIVDIQAQYLQKPLRILTPKDGLPQSFISGLAQDKDGFVWIGTRNGLARYDGMHFKLFRHDSKDSASLASNLIISMSSDKRNRIWIEHESSNIDYIDPVTETIKHVTDNPLFRSHPVVFTRRGWTTDDTGNLWCIQKANGLYRFDWKNNKVVHFTSETHGLASDTIRGLLEDGQQHMWIVSQRGISEFNPKTGIFKHTVIPFTLDFSYDTRSDAEIITIHERKNGEIMFGDRQRLIFYNPKQNSFRTIPFTSHSKLSIHSLQTGPDDNEYLESEGIVYRYHDTVGLIPVGDIGLVTFRNAQSFMVDRSGLIWLGTNAAGIHQIDLSAPFFETHTNSVSFYYDLLRQELGILLDHFAGWPLQDKEFNASSYFFRSTYDSNQRLWMALRDRIGSYDVSQEKYLMLPPVPEISNRDHLTWGIRGIAFSPQRTLWTIGDKGYIGYFDTLNRKWMTFLNLSFMKAVNPNFTLNDILADQDKLWITSGSGDGLFCVDIRTKQIRQINQNKYPDIFPTNLLLGLSPDPSRSNLLWIGTYEGLVCLNKQSLKSEVFSIDQGLPDNTIYAIQQDKAGYLWLSTNKGICRFHPVTHEVRIFQSDDGLPGNEFNRFHSLRLPDGRLAFGGTDGWTLFDPNMIKPDNYQPQVAFTNFKIKNEAVNSSTGKSLLSGPLNSPKTLLLQYDENTLAFEFAGLEFNQPKKLKYRYQLKNYDDKWIVTDNPSINYTKLPPGQYSLSVNTTNTTGQWSSQIRTLSIVIKPPFWRTWWAYFIYLFLVAGVIWVYIQYRVNNERMRQKVLLKEREAVQLKTVDELKTKFFSNITHEFRTPLTLILIPVQRLKLILPQTEALHWTTAIERNANQLLRLINQLLDFSKLESGALKVNETRGNLNDAIKEFLESFYDEAEANGIGFKIICNQSMEDYFFDADKLEQIIRNLVANAIKFTLKGGEVEVICSTQNPASENKRIIETEDKSFSGVYFIVRDTGIGIPSEQLPHIFTRFYQINNVSTGRSAASHPKGSGIGLALVKELVDLQQGTIHVSSSEINTAGWNTVFTVWLPCRPAISGGKFENTNEQQAPKTDMVPSTAHYLPKTNIAPEEKESKQKAGILLVEDNDELAEFIADSLPKSYNISRAANGAEAFEKALEFMPDLVISDVLMPVMDGYEFCANLKRDKRTDHIPLIMLTAKAAYDNRIEGLSVGADDYLTKPFHIKELQLRVKNLLERQRLLREKLCLQLSNPASMVSGSLTKTKNDPQDIFIQKLCELVEEKLDDSSFSVQELATAVGMSRSSLYNKLKTLTGLPAGDIIKNYRLKRAAQFLKEGNNSSETAYKVGFESPAYFSKCFKEFYQVTPLEFIQKVN